MRLGVRVGVRDAVLVLTDNELGGRTSIGLLARIKKPTVESNPAVSPVRRVVAVTGTGFAPHHDVEIGFDRQPQQTVRTKADGSFLAYMVVLPNGPQGPRLLFGHSAGYSKTIADEFPFLVVLSISFREGNFTTGSLLPDRPTLEQVLDQLRPGDTLVV